MQLISFTFDIWNVSNSCTTAHFMWWKMIVGLQHCHESKLFWRAFPFTEGILAQTQGNNTTIPSIPRPTSATTSTTLQVTCPKNIQVITKPFLVRLKVTLKKGSSCEGQLYLQYPNRSTVPLCFNSHLSRNWWYDVCKDMRCGPFDSFKPISKGLKGLGLTSNMTLNYEVCSGLTIACQGVCVFLRKDLLYRLYEFVCCNVFLDVFFLSGFIDNIVIL